MKKVAAVGDNCMDVYDSLDQAYPGGNPVNVAVYTVRLGGQASYTGVVGDDKYGRIMQDALSAKNVDISHLRVLPGATAITHVELKDGDRVFGDYEEGVLKQFKLTDDDIEFIAGHDLMVTGLWGMIENDLGRIRARGVPIAFDFATKLDDPVVGIAMPEVDYAFFAYDEDDEDFIRDYLKKQHARGPRLAVATLGEKGSLAYDGRDFTTFGIVPCEVKDTMGAGDSYIAAFLQGVLAGAALSECMRMGAENSSKTISYMGAW
jgi:Sugar kinases, ribokinase family